MTTFNGQPIEALEASLPGERLCSCGAPMRSDGSKCTRYACTATTMKIGDVYIGPRGGRREVEGYEWDEGWEDAMRYRRAPFPEAGREVVVLIGDHRQRRERMNPGEMGWFGRATKVTEGEGVGPPWASSPRPSGS